MQTMTMTVTVTEIAIVLVPAVLEVWSPVPACRKDKSCSYTHQCAINMFREEHFIKWKFCEFG